MGIGRWKVWPEDTGGLTTFKAKEVIEKQLAELAQVVDIQESAHGYAVQQDLGFIVVNVQLLIGAKGWMPPQAAIDALKEKEAQSVARKAERARAAEKERKRLQKLARERSSKSKLTPKKKPKPTKKRASKAKKKKAR